MTTRTWADREEWAAAAESSVRTRCFPHERVSARPEDWLSSDDLAELRALIPLVVKTARRDLNRAIRTHLNAFSDEPKGAGWGAWYDALDDERRKQHDKWRALRDDRSNLNNRARMAASEYADVDDLLIGLGSVVWTAKEYAAEECPEVVRLGELAGVLRERRDAAAEEAAEGAVRREVAERNSDEGWAKELERRANFTTGVVFRDGRLV